LTCSSNCLPTWRANARNSQTFDGTL
jgi:hypothetical protein